MSVAATSKKRRRIMPVVVNRRSVIIVEVMADGANFGLFVQWRSKQKNSFTGASARKALPRIPLRRLGAGPEKHVPEKRGPAFR
jgi:hypothetical protein